MKNILALLVFTTCALCQVSGQIGFSGAYKTFTADSWDDYFRSEFAENPGSATGYAAAVNYWFRLKNRRIEFLPELSYERFENMAGTSNFEHRILGFYFNTNIYPFDFESDCDCPTWSKTGNFFTKGFFIQVSPGIWQLHNRYETDQQYEDENLTWAIGGGAGLDLGISDFLTVTPMVKMYYSPDNTWNNLPGFSSEAVAVSSNIRQLYAGLKIGFRWQQEPKFRRR